MTTIPLADARARLSQIVDDAVRTHERVEITRNGSRAVVMLSADDYDVLLETLDVLADAQLVQEIRDAIGQVEAGESYALEDVAEEMRGSGRSPG
jgi:prevent-host-death family protein